MQLLLCAVGRKMPGWVQQGTEEYQKRLPRQWQFTIRETAQSKLGSADLNKAKETEVMLASLPERAHLVALDNRGETWSTKELADRLTQWQGLGKPVCLMIGGPDGLHDDALDRSQQRWSLSPLTFPHPLVRVLVVEQLYRAHSLNINHPYHRA